MKYGINQPNLFPCLCDIGQKGIWFYAKQLFPAKKYETLALHRPFTITRVDENFIYLKIQEKPYQIPKDVIIQTWDLIKAGPVSRAQLENSGIQNSSQIVCLLTRLPGVVYTLHPITLSVQYFPSASFLTVEFYSLKKALSTRIGRF